jgi:hypothetical protein
MCVALEGVSAEHFGQRLPPLFLEQRRLSVLGTLLAAACFVPLRHLSIFSIYLFPSILDPFRPRLDT